MRQYLPLFFALIFNATASAQKTGSSTPTGSVPWTVTAINPSSGTTGTLVEIKGFGFTNTSAVRFGGVPAASFTQSSDSLIKAVVGAGATGEITITTPFGIPFPFPPPPIFTFIASSSFPVITSIDKTTAGQGEVIMITGENFTNTAKVFFGGTPASYEFVSSSVLLATVGAGSSGNVAVVTGTDTAFFPGFVYDNKPLIESFTPALAGTGDTVIIKGKRLATGGKPAVSFGSVISPYIITYADTLVRAAVGNGASGSVAVTTINGFGSKAGFVYKAIPVIDYFTPTAATGGANIYISGRNFTGTTAVSFGGVPAASFSVASDSGITASVGAGASGNVVVTNSYGIAAKAGFIFSNCNPHSSVTNISICAAQLPYTWGGAYRYTGGTYSDTLTTASGCDSFATLNLTIRNVDSSTTIIKTCQGSLPYTWNGVSYPNFGTYSLTLINPAGCDSIAVLILEPGPKAGDTLKAAVCVKSLPYTWHNKSFTSTGIYTDTLTSYSGCDSLTYLQLKVDDAIPAPEPFDNTVTYPQYGFAQPLSALFAPASEWLGTFLWYTGESNQFSLTSPLPSTTTAGTFIYYASLKGIACESPKTKITVIVLPDTSVTSIDTVYFCPDQAKELTAPLTGNSYKWEVNKGAGYGNILDSLPGRFDGITSKTLFIEPIPSSWAGYKFRCLVDGIYSSAFLLKYQSVYTGETNGNWQNAVSWSCGSIPDANTDVIINSGSVTINVNTTIRSLKLSSSASIIVSPGVNLTIVH
ncbi:MAG: IPT/TIG domain-containing protein [Ferruginibacter sp.]